jgi:hypothetical protein
MRSEYTDTLGGVCNAIVNIKLDSVNYDVGNANHAKQLYVVWCQCALH